MERGVSCDSDFFVFALFWTLDQIHCLYYKGYKMLCKHIVWCIHHELT